MQYRKNPKTGEDISLLAYGCMRFPRDERETERQIRYAIDQGINYFDTAYMYGASEATLGRILAKDNLRAKVKIATKLPHYLGKKQEDFDRIFQTQLRRLQTDHIEYYMIHMLPALATWERLVHIGIIDWLTKKKKSGEISQIGFSFHGPESEFIALIDAWDWDFCMIQYNYYDINFQAGRRGLEYAAGKGIPLMIMEPLRGGTLVHKLPPKAKQIWDEAPEQRSAAEWGLRWVFNHPQVLTALSGMSTMEMIEENVRVAKETLPGSLTEEELTRYNQVREAIQAGTKVSCTGCGYCMPCPFGVDIPLNLTCLNETVFQGKLRALTWYIATTTDCNASLCTQCGKCEKLCPQEIKIQEKLAQTVRELEGFPYKPLRFLARKRLQRKRD